ncbi:MAG: EamA family transporter [Pseudomonadales bacterium]|nr:EamA family transporter [Pseudomonadales bacterium]NRA16058.1 EamA family transporter [Oceanospirillaceae bacterium]
MSWQPMLLIVISAFMHALWNSIGKRSATGVSFYVWALAAGTLMFCPLLIINWQQVIKLPEAFWWLLLVSGIFQCLYLTGLAKAYQSAELSLIYPLARALPVLIVPVFILLIYGESSLSGKHIIAIAMIATGALVLPLSKWRDLNLRVYFTPAVAWALLAAAATAGYSLTDSAALKIMRDSNLSAFEAGSSFVILQAGSVALCMLPVLKFGFREAFQWPDNIAAILTAGFFSVSTYLFVLIGMSMVEEVSYVVALRQLSIPIGIALGVLWLREKVSLPRMQGVCIMLAGLLLVSI